MEKMARFIVKYRFLITLLVLLITALLGYRVGTMSFQVLLYELFPPKHPYVQLNNKFYQQFGGANGYLVELAVKKGDIFNKETLHTIKRVNDKIYFNLDCMRNLTLSIAQRKVKTVRGYGGSLDVSAIMWPSVPETREQIASLKEACYTSKLIDGFLVSKDAKAAVIYGELWETADYAKFFRFLQEIKAEEENDNISIHMVGMPILYGWIYHYLPQMNLIFLISLGFCIAILVILFSGRIHGVAIPLLVGIISTIWGLGFAGIIGNLNPLMIVLPFLIGARALSHSVQYTRRYLEELEKHKDTKKAAEATIVGLFLVSFSAIVTDACGFFVLVMARIIIIQRLAFICTFWLLSIFLVASIFGPLLCTFIPVRKRDQKTPLEKSLVVSFFNRFHTKMASWQMGKPRFTILGIYLIFGLLVVYYSRNLVVGDVYPGSPILWPDSVYNQDCKEINTRFDTIGTDNMNIIVEGKEATMETPEVVNRIAAYERYIVRALPDIVKGSQSLILLLEKLNMELHEGDPKWEIIPDSINGIGTLFFMYREGGDPQDFDKFTDPAYQLGNIQVFLKDHTGKSVKKAIEVSKTYFDSLPEIEGVSFKLAGGLVGVTAATNEEIEWCEVWTILLAMVAIFILCSFTFRSLVAGIILSLPLVISNFVAFAFMVYKGIGLDINTLPVAAVGIGVGVDYGIYLLGRIEEEYAKCGDLSATILKSLSTAGNGVIFTALTLAIPVILWYFLSDLKFQAEMGLQLGVLMIFNALGALIFQPAAVYTLKPKFILQRFSK